MSGEVMAIRGRYAVGALAGFLIGVAVGIMSCPAVGTKESGREMHIVFVIPNLVLLATTAGTVVSLVGPMGFRLCNQRIRQGLRSMRYRWHHRKLLRRSR